MPPNSVSITGCPWRGWPSRVRRRAPGRPRARSAAAPHSVVIRVCVAAAGYATEFCQHYRLSLVRVAVQGEDAPSRTPAIEQIGSPDFRAATLGSRLRGALALL